MKWSPDGKLLAAAAGDGLKVWDLRTGQIVGSTRARWVDRLNGVAWSPDGKRIAYGGLGATANCVIREVSSWKVVHKLPDRPNGIQSIAWSPKGQIAEAGSDNLIIVWDASTGKKITTLRGHEASVNSVDWDPTGRYLVSGSSSTDNTVRIWDVNVPSDAQTIRGDEAVARILWARDRDAIVTSGPAGTRLVALGSAEQAGAIPICEGHGGLSPDGRFLAVAGKNDDSWHIEIRDFPSGIERNDLRTATSIGNLCWAPDNRHLAVHGTHPGIEVWNVHTGRKVSENSFKAGIRQVSWAPDARSLAVVAGGIHVYQCVGAKEVRELLPTSENTQVTAMCWSPDGRRLAVGKADGSVLISDMQGATLVEQLNAHIGAVQSLDWSANGRRLASGGERDQTVKIWNSATGEELLSLRGHEALITAVKWSPQGKRLASASWDGVIKIWDASFGYQFGDSHAYTQEAARLHYRNGLRLASQMRYAESDEAFRKASGAETIGLETALEAYHDRRNIHQRAGALARGLADADRLVELVSQLAERNADGVSPGTVADAHASRGWFLLKQKRLREAVTDLTTALKVEPDGDP